MANKLPFAIDHTSRGFAAPPWSGSFASVKMTAEPQLNAIAAALAEAKLEAVLIGNAAAAIQGAPVTTLDFDFLFRATKTNLAKLKRFARSLEAMILRPYYPASGLFRVINDDTGLQVDFMSAIHGIKSFSSLRSRAEKIDMAGHQILVADLEDVIASKRAAGRPRDLGVLDVLEKTLRERQKSK